MRLIGGEDEDAVLVTGGKTFKLTKAETSNTLLLLPPEGSTASGAAAGGDGDAGAFSSSGGSDGEGADEGGRGGFEAVAAVGFQFEVRIFCFLPGVVVVSRIDLYTFVGEAKWSLFVFLLADHNALGKETTDERHSSSYVRLLGSERRASSRTYKEFSFLHANVNSFFFRRGVASRGGGVGGGRRGEGGGRRVGGVGGAWLVGPVDRHPKLLYYYHTVSCLRRTARSRFQTSL